MDSVAKTVESVLRQLKAKESRENVDGMARFGIRTANVFGVTMPEIRALGRRMGHDHALAAGLWATGNYEARILAALVDVPREVTRPQMEDWVKEFDNWGICDGCCFNLFDRTPFAYEMALEWSKREAEFVKRAGFSLMAGLAVHDKKAAESKFKAFFPVILREADDGRNFVKKAVNWALRAIGKRSPALNEQAIRVARELRDRDSSPARWIGADALRELTSDKVQTRLKKPRT